MNYKQTAWLSVHLGCQPGSIQRLLGTVRRRGFEVQSMMLTRNRRPDQYCVEMRLHGERSFETLARHIANLFEVATVRMQPSTTPFEYATPAACAAMATQEEQL